MRGETVTVLTAGSATDSYSGDTTVPDWSSPTERDVYTLAPAEPRPSDEPVQDSRNSMVNGWTLYLPADDPIVRTNRVRVRGEVYPVQGHPAAWGTKGIVVQAYRTDG